MKKVVSQLQNRLPEIGIQQHSWIKEPQEYLGNVICDAFVMLAKPMIPVKDSE